MFGDALSGVPRFLSLIHIYKENPKKVSEYKVVRGGSYIERPKYSTAYSRKGFYPYPVSYTHLYG